MGSLDAPGSIKIVDKQNANFRNEGGAIVTTSGLLPQTGPTSSKISTLHETQGFDRSAAEFGTQPDKDKSQYSTLCINPGKKVATSDDASLGEGTISLETGKVEPSAVDQPEIFLKPVSQRSTYHLGGKVVIRNSDTDGLVGRKDNTGFTPGP